MSFNHYNERYFLYDEYIQLERFEEKKASERIEESLFRNQDVETQEFILSGGDWVCKTSQNSSLDEWEMAWQKGI